MLTIAGGILLAVLLIVTAPLWISLLFWLLVIALILGVGFGVFLLIANNPELSTTIVGAVIVVFLFVMISQMISGWWERKKKREVFQKPLEEQNISDTEDNTNETGKEKNSIFEKIDQVREKEITRLKDEEERAEEAKRKENELLAERFITIKTALQELKLTYTEDEDISVEISELSSRLTLGKFSNYLEREIIIGLNRNDEGFYINDNRNDNDDDRYRMFDYSEEVIDHIVEQVGKFLAKRGSG
jgi:hypothetical protein